MKYGCAGAGGAAGVGAGVGLMIVAGGAAAQAARQPSMISSATRQMLTRKAPPALIGRQLMFFEPPNSGPHNTALVPRSTPPSRRPCERNRNLFPSTDHRFGDSSRGGMMLPR